MYRQSSLPQSSLLLLSVGQARRCAAAFVWRSLGSLGVLHQLILVSWRTYEKIINFPPTFLLMSGSRTRVRRTSPRRPSHSPRPACITVSNHPQSSRRAREQLKSGGIYDTKWNLKEEIEMLSRPVMIYPETDTNKAMKIWLPSQLPCPGKKGKGMDGEDPFQVKSLENEPQIPEPTTLKNPPTWSVITSNKRTPCVYIYIYIQKINIKQSEPHCSSANKLASFWIT